MKRSQFLFAVAVTVSLVSACSDVTAPRPIATPSHSNVEPSLSRVAQPKSEPVVTIDPLIRSEPVILVVDPAVEGQSTLP